MIDRRAFLGLGVGAFFTSAAKLAAQNSADRFLRPEQFGARGDGRSDDTQALQICIDAAGPGGRAQLRRGAVYRVNTNHRPNYQLFGGLKLRPGVTLDLNGAELKALPTASVQGAVVHAYGVDGWAIIGPGKITGERDIHLGRAGEWGTGISAFSSRDWRIAGGVVISNCWGDGILVYQVDGQDFCERFVIEDVEIRDCRRNGISVVGGRDGEIRSFHIHHISGTSPQGGIDLEPDDARYPNRNIRINDGLIEAVPVGLFVTVANQNILISGNDIRGESSGIIIGDNATDIRIEDNTRIESTLGNTEGAAIRTVVEYPSTVRGLHIKRNHLTGGGFFVLDFVGSGYHDLIISNNTIEAASPGVHGIARLYDSVFTNNTCTLGRRAGNGEFFLYLLGVSYGSNTYRNQSRFARRAVIRGGTDLGGESLLSSNLSRYVEENIE